MAVAETITGAVQVIALLFGFNGPEPTGMLNYTLLGASDPMTVMECMEQAETQNTSIRELVPGETKLIVCAPYVGEE